MKKIFIKNASLRLNIYVISSFLLIFIFYSTIVLNLNIHGDAKFQSLNAVASAQKGILIDHQAYRIFNINNERSYMPIAYPLTYESLFTILYIFGGETLLKLYSPIFAAFIFLTSYLCLKDFGTYKSLFISFIAVIVIGERLIMTPLIEPFMIELLLMAIWLLKKYFFYNFKKFLFVSIIFLGAAASIKQQGFIDALSILAFIFIYLIYKSIRRQYKIKNALFIFFICMLIFVSIPFFALKNQIDRTGTLAFSPGGTSIPSKLPFYKEIQPLLISKYSVNPKAIIAIQNTVGYNKLKFNYIDKLRAFLICPFIFYSSNTEDLYKTFNLYTSALFLIVICIGLLIRNIIYKRNRVFINFLVLLFLTEVTMSFVFKTPVTQYHSFGLIIGIFLLSISLFSFYIPNKIKIIFLSYFIAFFIIGYSQYILPSWTDPGREDNYQIEGYKKIGIFVNKNIPQNAIFLAGETSFRYYSQRDTIWINESIGDKVWKILYSENAKSVISYLKSMKINYIVINKAQTLRSGVGDFMPSIGLISLVNNSKYFTKIYDPYKDGNISVYKINYE